MRRRQRRLGAKIDRLRGRDIGGRCRPTWIVDLGGRRIRRLHRHRTGYRIERLAPGRRNHDRRRQWLHRRCRHNARRVRRDARRFRDARGFLDVQRRLLVPRRRSMAARARSLASRLSSGADAASAGAGLGAAAAGAGTGTGAGAAFAIVFSRGIGCCRRGSAGTLAVSSGLSAAAGFSAAVFSRRAFSEMPFAFTPAAGILASDALASAFFEIRCGDRRPQLGRRRAWRRYNG